MADPAQLPRRGAALAVAAALLLACCTRGAAGQQPLARGAAAAAPPPTAPQSANATAAAPAGNATGTAPGFDAALIVPNITTDCPVPNRSYAPEEVSEGDFLLVFAPVITGGGGTSGSGAGDNATCCEERAVELATCLGDGSLLVKSGCCSERCAALMRRIQSAGCIGELLLLFCRAEPTGAERVAPAVAGAARRCVGFAAPPAITCPDGRTIRAGGDGGPNATLVTRGAGLTNASSALLLGAGSSPQPASGPAVPGPAPPLPGLGAWGTA